MSANYLAFLANRRAKQALARPDSVGTGGGGITPTDLAGLPVPDYDDAADVPVGEFGKAGGVLYWNNDGTVEAIIPLSSAFQQVVSSGTASPNGSVVGNITNAIYLEISGDGLTLVTIWIFRGTVGQNTGWITFA